MAATVKLDLVEGSFFDNQQGVRTHRRMAFVSSIPVDAIADPNALVKALASAGMPQIGDKHPSGDKTVVVRHFVRGVGNDQARVEIYYSSPFASGGNSAYVLRDSTGTSSRTVQLVPGLEKPIRVSWTNPIDKHDTIPPKTASMHYRQPVQTITATTQNVSQATVDLCRSFVCHVNKTPWRGLGRGYWLLDGLETETNLRDPTFYTSMSLRFISRVIVDWSEVYCLERDGSPVLLSDTDAHLIHVFPYEYGIIGGEDKGMVRAGLYPTASFKSLTGIE